MKKFISIVLSALMLFSLIACGGNNSSDSSGLTSTSAPLPVSSSEPEPEPLEVAYLTGLERDADYPADKRILGVMVNNFASARPHRGISQADVLFEMKVEGGITRFLALFHQDYESIPEVGPVRSARDQFLQMLIPSWGFYVHDGPAQNQPANWMLRDYEYNEFDLQPSYSGLAWRDQTRLNSGYALEHTEFTDGEHIANVIENNELDMQRTYNSPIFAFHPYNEPRRELEDGNLDEIGIIHSSSYRTIFHYNSANNSYDMSQFNSSRGIVQETIDENTGEQLAFDNVLVLFAPMTLYYNSPLVKVDFGRQSVGYYFNGGQFELIRWSKSAPDQPLRLYVGDGSEETLYLNPGTSYIAVVDDAELESFYDTVMAGNGADIAGDGEITSGSEDPEFVGDMAED